MGGLVHMVPAVPPTISGLGDYAARLSEALETVGVSSRLLTHARVEDGAANASVDRIARPDGASLAASLADTEALLLHFSGYGYARWGWCGWVPDGIARWRRSGPGRRLVTLFHEVYAAGPPWRTSFWTSPPQQRIARRLAALSDAMVATSPRAAAQLQTWHPDRQVIALPVFSNVGELATPPPLEQRARCAVVFGGGHRKRTWGALLDRPAALAATFDILGIETIVDIGPPMDTPPTLAGRPVETLGPLARSQVSSLLASARAGLVDYPHHVFTKSGIIAGYLAHGVLCLNTSEIGELPDDLAEGRQFLHCSRAPSTLSEASTIARAGFEWYRDHDTKTAAHLFKDLFF